MSEQYMKALILIIKKYNNKNNNNKCKFIIFDIS